MALSAVKTFVGGEILYAADLNALNTNILNNALSLISPLTGNLDASSNDITAIDELAFTDAVANPSASGRVRRNGSALMWAIEDARTNTTTRVLTAQATTSGAPAASIGVGMLFNAESGDENPSNFGALDFIATDVGAGTEDTVLGVNLRVAGAALTEVWRLQATGAFRATTTHAITANRTYTFQDASDTVVMRDTTETLTNKTLTAPVLSGTATGTYTLGGTPTITAPTIGDFTNATHTHASAATGGTIDASQAAMEAAASTTVFVTPGRLQYHPGVAKVWLWSTYSAGVPQITAGYNIASLDDDGVGLVGVNFTTAFSTASYASAVGLQETPATNDLSHALTRVAGSIDVAIRNVGGAVDDAFSVICFGDQ